MAASILSLGALDLGIWEFFKMGVMILWLRIWHRGPKEASRFTPLGEPSYTELMICPTVNLMKIQ